MITYAFTLGDPLAALGSPTGYPVIAGFFYATRSHAGTSVMIAIIIVNTTSSCISTLATVSRQTVRFKLLVLPTHDSSSPSTICI